MRHVVIVALFVLTMTFLVYTGLNALNPLPTQAATQAVVVDRMFHLEFIAIAFLFSLITVPLVYSLIVFRRRPGDTGVGRHIEGNIKLELLWTIIPLITVIAFSYMGAQALGDTLRVDPQALQVKVTGFQWAWRFEYPDYGITSNALYLPVNRQVLLRLESPDVIHSFWVPEFRVKQDVVPGRETQLRITPTTIGEYTVRCAELCGVSHAYMRSPVVVVSQEDFDAWVAEKQEESTEATGPDAGRGQKLYETLGCKACHSVDGSEGVGPTWKGLFGSEVELDDGSVVVADEAFLAESIREPGAAIVAGFAEGTMPSYALEESQIADLIAFIESLK